MWGRWADDLSTAHLSSFILYKLGAPDPRTNAGVTCTRLYHAWVSPHTPCAFAYSVPLCVDVCSSLTPPSLTSLQPPGLLWRTPDLWDFSLQAPLSLVYSFYHVEQTFISWMRTFISHQSVNSLRARIMMCSSWQHSQGWKHREWSLHEGLAISLDTLLKRIHTQVRNNKDSCSARGLTEASYLHLRAWGHPSCASSHLGLVTRTSLPGLTSHFPFVFYYLKNLFSKYYRYTTLIIKSFYKAYNKMQHPLAHFWCWLFRGKIL